MSRHTRVTSVTHWEDSDLVIMARVVAVSGDPVNQATLDSIFISVWNRVTGQPAGVEEELDISEVIFNTLQNDNRWTVDSVGYNFRCLVPGERFATGGVTYRVEIMGVPVTGAIFPLAVVDVEAQNRFSG